MQGTPWAALAGGIQQKYHGYAERAVIQANNRLSAQNAESKNKLRVASNALEAAKGNLARWVQSVNNQRRMDSAGEALEATIVNARRAGDQATRSSFSRSIREAEEAGQMAASAAMAGVSGDVVDMVNVSTRLRNEIVRQDFSDRVDLANHDTARRAGNIMSQMVGGLDSSLLLDTLDYNVDVATFTPWKSTFYNFIQGAFKGFGMDAGLSKEKPVEEDAGKQHSTDYTKSRFGVNNDRYMTLDSDAEGRDYFDKTTGNEGNYGWDSFSNSFSDEYGKNSDAWATSNKEAGNKDGQWSW